MYLFSRGIGANVSNADQQGSCAAVDDVHAACAIGAFRALRVHSVHSTRAPRARPARTTFVGDAFDDGLALFVKVPRQDARS
eukprot:10569451-Lingulodinium_polyedra.AAC.1